MVDHPAATMSDEDATQRFLAYARDGDRAALEALLRDHLGRAIAQARRIVGNPSDAEDAVQDALVALVRSRASFDGSVPFAAWLARLVHRSAIQLHRSRRRRRRRESVVVPAARLDGDDPGSDLDADLVRDELGHLAERYRLPLDLHYLSGLSIVETAQALGISEVLVRKRLERAKEQMLERLRRQGVTIAPAALLVLLMSTPVQACEPAPLIAGALLRAAAPATTLATTSVALAAAGMVLGAVAVWTVQAPDTTKPTSIATAAVARSAVVGTAIDPAAIIADHGFAYVVALSADRPDALGAFLVSTLEVYEDGVALGPAHAEHVAIRTLGAGRFSHWTDGRREQIYFSASDNSDPRTNGRRYSYRTVRSGGF